MEIAHPLDKRRIGRTDMAVTALSMGGAGLGGIFGEVSETAGVAAVEKALELGMNWLDTSPYYLDSERRMGLALRGVPRQSYYLSTKVGTHRDRYQDYSADAVRWSIDNSLRTLGLDDVDIGLIHDPLPYHLDQALGPDGALEALIDLKRQGIIKAIGIGVQNHYLIRRAIDTGMLDMALTVNDYTLLRQSVLEGVCDDAESRAVSVVGGAALAMGLLSGRDPLSIGTSRWTPPKDEVAAALRLYDWCKQRDVSILGLALQFSLRQRRLAATLIGASSAEEVEGCWKAAVTPIDEEIWIELTNLLEEIRLKS
ncbi:MULTISPECIES: aldo/keto reductase [unclassified Paenibacillus]|uniref:aldo/keto reductase n=1 Tax=unclassified Paenibacillus TaxID=185978 RepID=UPI001AE86CC9|nr:MULTISPECIES: aldo/keto reductase [unclassified Paenibacillus]MBP1153697.1 aryl-alcohol dehydrogenase-like predicted oxidoreductase [Paenibacillus sp. PvP091]MBP1170918.1 aryl-alcohol dehydrogenase-like predicted oxidoreductase [Paenibacillus sp. PvR098]MBP2441946.1 aryl-alcohol dehydrogenase-like predicted oxidoreductase [Paenibacillus sp. PvP052]